jgi:hypothetical protein
VYNGKHFYKIIIRHWKKNIFKKCNFLIIIFFSQIVQATTLEKFNVACFPRIIFPYFFFKPQRLKYFVTCFPRIIFLYLNCSSVVACAICEKKIIIKKLHFLNMFFFQCLIIILEQCLSLYTDLNRNVWNTSLLVWCYQTFSVLIQKQIHFRHRIYFLQVLYLIYFYYKMYQYYSML